MGHFSKTRYETGLSQAGHSPRPRTRSPVHGGSSFSYAMKAGTRNKRVGSGIDRSEPRRGA
jgi:hypothetical protein